MEVPILKSSKPEIEPRNVANYFIFISHDSLEKIPPKKKKRADDILRYAESKFIIGEFVREFDREFVREFDRDTVKDSLAIPKSLNKSLGFTLSRSQNLNIRLYMT